MATNFRIKRSAVANKRPTTTNLDLGELALNTYDGFLFAERDGVGVTTVANLTPWYENVGAASIYYSNSVGIGTTDPLYNLDVRGAIGGYTDLRAPHRDDIVTYTVTVATKDTTHRYQGQGSSNGYKIDGEFSPFLVLTPGRTYRFDQSDNTNSGHPINFYLESDKTTTYSTGVTVNGSAGNSGAYTQIVVGDETPVVLHYQCVNHGYMGNAVQVNSNVVNTNYAAIIRGGLTANSAKIEDLTANRVVVAGTGGELQDSANLTFNGSLLDVGGNVDISGDLDVDGLTELDDLRVSAGSTFLGVADFDHQIVGLATNNIIPFLFNAWNDLPSAGTYHGAFAHVHGRGKAYFAHAANWYELVNKELNGTIGVGTEVYNIGVTSVSTLDVLGVSTFRGNVDINASVDISTNLSVNNQTTLTGFTTLGSNLFVAGVSTFADTINGTDATFSGNVSIGGTLTYEDVTNVDAIGIVTARSGIKVLAGGINAVGIVTANGLDAIEIKDDGTSITTGAVSVIDFTGGNTITYNAGTRTVTVPVGGGGGGGTGGKFVENATGIHTLGNVGIGTTTATDKLNVLGDLALNGKLRVTELRLPGNNGQFLKSTGVGVTWASFPTTRTSTTVTATANQTSFSFTYNVGFLDVFVNGSKLKSSDFTATNGTSVVLAVGAFVGDTVELISYNTTASGSGGGSGITDIVQDTTPQLGGNLDLNSKNITGTGNISITGDVTATNLSGNGASLTALNGSNIASGTIAAARVATLNQDTTGNAGTFTVTANNSTNETVYPVFVDGATGAQGAESDTGLTYNPSTGNLTATKFTGDGSSLTGISGGVTVQDEGSALSTTATTLNFAGSGVVASGSGATKTITIAGGTSQNVFQTIAVSGQSNVVADSATDTLTFAAGSNVTITTNASTDTVTIAAADTQLSNEQVQDIVGAMFSSNTETDITATYQDADGTIDLAVDLSSLNASNLDSGTIPDARFPSTLPAISGANLTNLPSGTPTTSDIQVVYEITNQTSFSYFRFAGNGVDSSANNPDIYLERGQKYRFINNSGGAHPFQIQTTGGSPYTTGVTYPSGNSASSGNIDFAVRWDAPAQLKYQCTSHGSMVGNIYINGGQYGGMTLLASATLSSSGTTAANITFNTAGFQYLYGKLHSVTRPSGGIGDIGLRWNGTSSTVYDFVMQRLDNNGSGSARYTQGANQFYYNMNGVAGWTSGRNQGVFELHLVNDGVRKPFNMKHSGELSGGPIVLTTDGMLDLTSAITSLEITTSDTDINGGTLELYGVR